MRTAYLEKRRELFRQALAPAIRNVADRFKLQPDQLPDARVVFDRFWNRNGGTFAMYVSGSSQEIHVPFLSQLFFPRKLMHNLMSHEVVHCFQNTLDGTVISVLSPPEPLRWDANPRLNLCLIGIEGPAFLFDHAKPRVENVRDFISRAVYLVVQGCFTDFIYLIKPAYFKRDLGWALHAVFSKGQKARIADSNPKLCDDLINPYTDGKNLFEYLLAKRPERPVSELLTIFCFYPPSSASQVAYPDIYIGQVLDHLAIKPKSAYK
jgi:hypothetical protein